MIEVRVCHQNCVNVVTNMSQTLPYSIWTGFDSLIQRTGPQTNAREIRIDQERMIVGFKLKTVDAEISDAN